MTPGRNQLEEIVRGLDGEAREYLIKKGPYFYRKDKSGYTEFKFDAGRYTKEDAEREAEIEPWHMKAIHQDDVPAATGPDKFIEKQDEAEQRTFDIAARLLRERDAALVRIRDLEDRLANATQALEFYANPEIYKPHPHGLAFDRRDVSLSARTALDTIRRTNP